MGEVLLEGELAHEETFLIGNESAPFSGTISESNQLKTGTPIYFNGNDPVGLFKDDELIDVIGHFNNDEDFAKEETKL
ncbi:hypothetical protein APR41_13045 [Salegentibacter salinarum]|uniref:Uncharacterized protein n=1 Tax=Salegentibacter salinarum TaxID=447422 RepID=A0A2N0U1R5_9FLAO|nr:hypothetical protein [Salegentibacter salinarum]PKD20953.1 hypothetical protein APR41_13045 [Salegentibacter salinarum]SKB80416.1 hypothetical protein SAMN05660903_02661 [Salegentibacter salinarum]